MTTTQGLVLCARVRPLLEATLGRIPVALASFSNGLNKPAQWHVALHHRLRAEDAVESGTRRYFALR